MITYFQPNIIYFEWPLTSYAKLHDDVTATVQNSTIAWAEASILIFLSALCSLTTIALRLRTPYATTLAISILCPLLYPAIDCQLRASHHIYLDKFYHDYGTTSQLFCESLVLKQVTLLQGPGKSSHNNKVNVYRCGRASWRALMLQTH